jgi:hypothetical protein
MCEHVPSGRMGVAFSSARLDLLDLEPGVSKVEVQAESEREPPVGHQNLVCEQNQSIAGGRESICPSRKFGGAQVLCFVKRIHRGRGAAGIGQPVGFWRGYRLSEPTWSPPAKAGQRRRSDRTQQVLPRQLTLPDVRTDDEDRQLAAARPPARGPAVAPTDSPACPFPATGASGSRDNTQQTISGNDTDRPR